MGAFRFAFWLSSAIAIAALALAIACGAPSSFDNLVGGDAAEAGDAGETGPPGDLRIDESLLPPRPTGPLTASWINSQRPHFRWIVSPNTVGARVEICRNRECRGETKKFEVAQGVELKLAEDLELGVWYWRLFGRTADAVGSAPSATWEFIVRGGKSGGNAAGSIIDLNGDGKPEIALTAPFEFDGGAFTDIYVYLGTSEPTQFKTAYDDAFPYEPTGTDLSSPGLAFTDIRGSGFTDLVVPVLGGPPGTGQFSIFTYFGRADFEPFPTSVDDFLPLPPAQGALTLHELGDLDGDGRGDVMFSTTSEIYGMFGGPKGLGVTSIFFHYFPDPDGGVLPTTPFPISGGFDRNNDLFSEGVFGWPYPLTPLAYVVGGPDRVAPFDFGILEDGGGATPPIPTAATTFASGDFDGDGVVDTAFATTIDTKPSVCITLGGGEFFEDLPTYECWTPDPAPPAGFAVSLAAADLDEDGREEILVGSTSNGVDIVRRTDLKVFTAEHRAIPFGTTLTTIWPGRPGPAIWAATREDGSQIAIFRGVEPAPATVLLPPSGSAKFGPALR